MDRPPPAPGLPRDLQGSIPGHGREVLPQGRRYRAALGAPSLHFTVLGALLFTVLSWHAPAPVPRGPAPPIVITAADTARLRAEWQQLHGRAPGAAVVAHLIDDAVDEEVLHREALAAGLDRRDPLVRDRLVRLARFLDQGSSEDPDALAREARRLGLAERDVVIRRHLVQSMRLALAHLEPAELPAEPEIAAYLAAHGAEFTEPARVHLTHVYLSRDRVGRRPDEIRRLRDALRRTGVGPAEGPPLGDPFIQGADIEGSTARLDGIFGAGFAAALEQAPLGEWSGPVASSYGWHMVWVHAREKARVPPLATVRGRITHTLLEKRRQQRLRERLSALRARYTVRVETPRS